MSIERPLAICVEYYARRPGVRSRLEEQVNAGLKAQRLDQTRDVISVPRDDEEPDAGPRITDTTGEAAIRTDRARRMLAELDHAENALLTDANRLIGHPIASHANLTLVLGHHGHLIAGTVKQSARVFDRALGETLGRRKPDPGKAHDGLPGCQSCARLVVNRQPWWSDPNYAAGNPTDLGGMLTEKVRLCRACQRFAVNQEPTRLPTVAELQHRKSDPRGQWPRRYAQVPRAS